MAKKSSGSSTNYGIVKATAFWGIIISGIAGIVTFVFQCLMKWGVINGSGVLGRLVSVMNLIANIALFVSVFLAAYQHSKGKKKVFKALFWIFSILALLGILGFNVLNMF